MLEDADRRFAADSTARGAEAWAEAFAADGVIWQRGGPPIVGLEAIRESMQRHFSDPQRILVWEPHTSALSPAGDLGFTIGCYQRLRQAPSLPPAQEGSGTYMTVWRRQADGSWRAVFDTGIDNTSP